MNATDFIITHLKDFTEGFQNARVRYEHDTHAHTHTIEVYPQSVFDSQAFLDWECDLFDRFSLEYPGDIIGFISEDALVGIEKTDFECEGSLYGSYTINPDIVFDAPVAKIEVSTSKIHGAIISVSESQAKDIFEETLISNDEFLNNYKLAA